MATLIAGGCSSNYHAFVFPGGSEERQAEGSQISVEQRQTPNLGLVWVSSQQASLFFLHKREGMQVGDGRGHEF